MSYDNYDYVDFSDLNGKIIEDVTGFSKYSDEITFTTNDGVYKLLHFQECCEDVSVEDLDGELSDLIGSTVVSAEEADNFDEPETTEDVCLDYTYTWTFYKIQTTKGHAWIRWLGASNGYYSESVNFVKVKNN